MTIRSWALLLCTALACLWVFSGSYLGSPSAQLPPADNESPLPEPTPVAATVDNATLNLHRWGAVTIFHGLPSDRVNAIAEDADGWLWFGTDNGLVRYDGRNVEAKGIENLVGSRHITALKLDSRGNLWVGTDAGAVRLHHDGNGGEGLPETRGRTITGISVSPQNEVVLTTAKGEIIIYRERAEETGYSSRSREEERRENESPKPLRLSATRIDQSTQPLLKPNPPDQTLPLTAAAWLGPVPSPSPQPGPTRQSGTGEWVIGSGGRGALVQYSDELREVSTRPPRPYFVTSIFHETGRGRIWLGDGAPKQSGNLWTWALSRGGHSGSNCQNCLTRFPLNTGEVTALHGGGGQLWVGTNRQGAYLIKADDDNPKPIEHLTFENTAGGLRSNHINIIFRDREGLVWFGTDRGVCRYDRESFRTTNVSTNPESNFVRSLLRTMTKPAGSANSANSANSRGETFCGTNHGLFRFLADTANSDLGSWAEVADLKGRSVYALYEDGAGTIWAGTHSGLFIKPKDVASFNRVSTRLETIATIITEDQSGESAAEGQNLLPPSQPFPSPSPSPTPSLPTATADDQTQSPSAESSNPQQRESVRAITGFRQQIYAAIFERGIEKIEAVERGYQRTLVLSNKAAQHAICFAVDGTTALWFGTSDGELWRYDGSQIRSVPLPEKVSDTRTDRAVRAISVSHIRGQERLWFGTSHGLYLREGETLRQVIPAVNVHSLLVTEETSGREVVWCATQNAGLIKLLSDGEISSRFDTEQGLASQQVFALISDQSEIWIGTSRGVVRHQPNLSEPRLRINRLVADRIYPPEFLAGELSLPHTRSNFLLEVTGIGGRSFPSQFKYEFTLKGENGQPLRPPFRTPDPQYAVEDLKSGGYQIMARTISRDLVYSAPLTVRLRIESAPFPWSTLLLTSLLGMAIAAAVWAYRQQRRLARTNRALEETNSELHETRLRLASETEAERSRVARDLHDQTLADLRHLLVLTDQLPAPVTEDSSPSPALLRREIEAISNEIRHICEDLSPSTLENIGFLPALEWALSDAVAQLPAAEKFAYVFNCDPELEDRLQLSPIEEIQLYRIAQEALNNICQHAKANQVRMSIGTENDGDLVIEIEDDGIGFDGSTTDRTDKIGMTGHGIANIRSRANLIGASVAWKYLAPGCQFRVIKNQVVKKTVISGQ